MPRQIRHIITAVFVILTQAIFAQQRPDAVVFSQKGGFYDESFTLSLFCSTENHIRYTTNGSTPDSTSTLYKDPLYLDSLLFSKSNIYTIRTTPESIFFAPDTIQHCITIRAAVFDANENRKSDVATQSYFIKSLGCDTHGLPIVSVNTDSLALFDYNTGIYIPGAHFNPDSINWTGNYYQEGKEWERRVNIEYYENENNTGINQQCGMRIHGGNGRRGLQKCVKFYAREEYGKKKFKYRFFEDLDNESFDHLVLHPFFTQWYSYGINYQICNMMARDLGLESLATRPVVLFLNGEYWGIYYLCEKPDENYLHEHFGGNEDEYNIMGNWYNKCENGSAANFLEMMTWLKNADLREQANYDYLCSLIDIENFIDYYCLELFIANNDWPDNNMRCWQYGDGKWRWIFYDGDAALVSPQFDAFANATNENGTGWPADARSTLMFRKLLENDQFTETFRERFTELMITQFSYNSTKQLFDAAANSVRDEVPHLTARFGTPHNLTAWENNIATIDDFLQNRVRDLNQQINDISNVGDTNFVVETIYPNPSNGDFYLILSCDKHEIIYNAIAIYNVLGQKLSSKDLILMPGLNTVEISCDYAPGIYIMKIGNKTERFVIQ